MDRIKPGLKGQAEMVVGSNDTASRVGSGRSRVLATPMMINVMEEAALDAIEALLDEGKQSLGTLIDMSHVAATPIGMTVTATAEVTAVDGRKVSFKVAVHDEVELIGEGRHERVVVSGASFQKRVDEKAARRKRQTRQT